MKFKKVLAVILAMLMVCTLFAGCSNDNGKYPKKVVIGTQNMPNTEGIAKSLGYFKDAFAQYDVEVDLVDFSSGAEVNTALVSGDIDFALIGTCPVATGLSAGIDCQVIWIHDVLGSAESLVVKNSAGISSLKDLVGKTIATPFASTAHYSLLMALKNEGIDANTVDIIDMQPAEIYASWQANNIDGAYVWEPSLSQLIAEEGTIILTSKDMADAGYMTANLEVVRTEFAEKYPEMVEVYLSCLEKAAQLYKNDYEAAVTAISDGLGLERADAEYQMNGSIWQTAQEQLDNYFGGELGKTLYDTAAFLVEQGNITELKDEQFFKDAVNGSYLENILNPEVTTAVESTVE